MQSKVLDKSMKTSPIKNYYLDLPFILLVNESKHAGHYNFVDKEKRDKWKEINICSWLYLSNLITLSYIFETVAKILTG